MDVLLAAGTTPATTAKVTVAAAAPIALGLLVWGCVQFQVVTIMVRGSTRVRIALTQWH